MKAIKCFSLTMLIVGLSMIGTSDRPAHAQVPNLACGPIRSSDQAFVRDDTWRITGNVPACVYQQPLVSHFALDICFDNWNSNCKGCPPTSSFKVRHRAMLFGRDAFTPSYYWHVYFGSCPNSCGAQSGCNGGAGNYYVVQDPNSVWQFRQLHVWHYTNCPNSDGSCSKWASAYAGTVLGMLGGTGSADGPHVHADNLENGIRRNSWYLDAGVHRASPAGTIRTLGWPRLGI
jgi:hypothetical protein